MFEDKTFYDFLKNKDFTGAVRYMHECVPDYLCKWYALNAYDSISDEETKKRKESDELRFTSLENKQNWFDSRINQNDPFDMAVYEVDYEKLKKEGHEDMIPAYEMVVNLLRNSLLLCSFCDLDVNHLPMWANYANGHQGYCIKYRITKKSLFYKMLYEPEVIKLNHLIAEVIHDANLAFDQKRPTPNTFNYRDMLFLLNNCKHKSWDYEHEYRCLYPILEGELKGRNVLNEQIGVEPVALYIGKDCNPDNRDRLIQIVHDVLKCKVYVCKISKTDFLSFEEC